MTNIIILTGNALRHTYVRMSLAQDPNITVIKSYCEKKNTLKVDHHIQDTHLLARDNSEKDFFSAYVQTVQDLSNPKQISTDDINKKEYINEIIELNPDVLVAFGCSIIRGQLLDHFQGRFLNVHLGLSPYYRGTGTNFWPLVNNEPEYVGATFMHIDSGIDTGNIIHQIRARIFKGDGPHQIGNRVILDIPSAYSQIIQNIQSLRTCQIKVTPDNVKYYKRNDFSKKATQKIYNNFRNGMIDDYLAGLNTRNHKAPIFQNPNIKVEG